MSFPNILTTINNVARSYLSESLRRSIKYTALRSFYGKDLRKLASIFGVDKEGSHYYAQHYQDHFSKLRKKKMNILEIGIGGYDNPEAGGRSLRMWKTYFPHANIFGLDIFDKKAFDEPHIKTFCGSQVDEELLERIVQEIGKIDIIIDDGSHHNEHVRKTFCFLFPRLSSAGIYVIEDLQTSYWENVIGQDWGGSKDLRASHTSMNFLKDRVDGLNYEEFTDESYEPTYFDRNIVAIHFYHNLVFIYKGKNEEGSNFV